MHGRSADVVKFLKGEEAIKVFFIHYLTDKFVKDVREHFKELTKRAPKLKINKYIKGIAMFKELVTDCQLEKHWPNSLKFFEDVSLNLG
jgi:hypothetical protein